MSSTADTTGEQRPYWHMSFACQTCGAKGLIPWDRLDRVLCCRRCSTWYRVGRDARLEAFTPEANMQISVRGSFSEWRQHRLRSRDWANDWLRRGGRFVAAPIEWFLAANWLGRTAVAGGAAALIVAATLLLTSHAAEPAAVDVPLPTTLVDRAPLFAQAWLAHDMPQMLRLTDKSQDRQLRQWSGKTPPPQPASAAGAAERSIEASIERREPHRALVAVRVSLLTHAGPGNEFVQHQQWVEREGVWYFLPQLPPTTAPGRRIRQR